MSEACELRTEVARLANRLSHIDAATREYAEAQLLLWRVFSEPHGTDKWVQLMSDVTDYFAELGADRMREIARLADNSTEGR